MRRTLIFAVLFCFVVASNASNYLTTSFWTTASCSGTPSGVKTIQTGVCSYEDYNLFYQYDCLGNMVVQIKNCTDSACTNCVVFNETVGTCLSDPHFHYQHDCSATSFPSYDLKTNVVYNRWRLAKTNSHICESTASALYSVAGYPQDACVWGGLVDYGDDDIKNQYIKLTCFGITVEPFPYMCGSDNTCASCTLSANSVNECSLGNPTGNWTFLQNPSCERAGTTTGGSNFIQISAALVALLAVLAAML